MARLGVNKDYLKKRNRGLVLQLVATDCCRSRTDLAKATGLTKTAISAIVKDLISKGYLEEKAVRRNSFTVREQGRNPIQLRIGPHSPKYVGVLVGRNYAEVALCDMTLKIYKDERQEQEWKGADDMMEAVYRLMSRVMEGEQDIIGIGISTPGPVDVKQGKIVNPGYFHGIKNLPMVDLLKKRYDIPMFLDHDLQSVALVEQLYGNGRSYQDVLVIGIDQGIGSGVIIGGRRYHSSSGFPPEFGHVSINHHGNKCAICGNTGCLETYIGTDVIAKKVEEATGEKLDFGSICQRDDNPKIRAILEEMMYDLSCGVVSLENILNFEVILLGVDGVYLRDRYIKMLEDMINERKFENRRERTLVRKVSFMEKNMILGAVCNAVLKTFEGDLMD